MADKLFIEPREFLLDSYRLARMILDTGYRPDFIVGLWRGGTPPGIAVQEFFAYHNIKTDHIAIRTSRYTGINQTESRIRVHNLDYLIKNANADDRLLLVDDVYEEGLTIQAVIGSLQQQMRLNMPRDVKVGTVYYKPERNKFTCEPDFYVHTTDAWLVFPHELEGLTEEEIRTGKGADILKILHG